MAVSEPAELWLFVFSNVLLLVAGGGLTVLSYRAYVRTRRRAFAAALGGFGTVTFGALVEAIYELGIRGSYELSGRELLALHTVEGLLIAAGLAALYYSLTQY